MSDERYELPEGWAWASLDEACVVNPRHERNALPDDALVSFIPMAAVDQKSGSISGESARPYGEVRKGFTHFAERDILFARITPCMENGKIAVARNLVNGLGCGTTEFHVLRPLGGILSEYLHRYLRQESFRRAAAANMSGTAGQLRVPTDYIKSVELPLAPLAEQRRIAAKIEALFEQSRTARQALDRIPPLLKKFRQSVLAAAFRGDLTRDWREQHPDVEPASALLERLRAERRLKWEEDLRAKGKDPRKAKYEEPKRVDTHKYPDLPEGWTWATLSQTAEFLDRMRVPVNDKERARRRGNIPYYGANRQVGWIDDYLFDEPIILLAEDGGFFDDPYRPVAYRIEGKSWVNNHAHVLRPLPGIDIGCLHNALNAVDMMPFVSGTTRLKLTQGKARCIPLRLAPQDEQRIISAKIHELFAQADTIEAAVEAARRQAENLEQSILTRAFRGGLVPQDSNDEPAPILLDRIRDVRESGKFHDRAG